jgi:hypothetical protein
VYVKNISATELSNAYDYSTIIARLNYGRRIAPFYELPGNGSFHLYMDTLNWLSNL